MKKINDFDTTKIRQTDKKVSRYTFIKKAGFGQLVFQTAGVK